jgi:radical SAM superfamily enzyme YgiQ (UPF0313 family)
MKVLLISANTEQINILPLPLGLNCVAVATRSAGHDVEFVDLMMTGEDTGSALESAVKGFHPDIIGISVRNIDDQNIESQKFLLKQVKAVIDQCRIFSSARIVLGGAGYSIFPERALTYLGADFGIRGEGERALPVLLERINRGATLSGVPGLYLPDLGLQGQREFAKDLDAFPLPDPHLWSLSAPTDQEIWIPFQTRRGCPMDCSYCSTATIEGHTIRKHSSKVIVDGLARHIDAGFRRFFFVDNTFNFPPSYAKEICQRFIDSDLKISWRCILYPAKIDEELIKDMAMAGCKEVSLGFESGCERILHSMNKVFSRDDVRQNSEMLADHGIQQMGFLLLGGPGETRESVEESLDFADSLPLDMLKITVGIRIYPDTALAKTAIDEGLIQPNEDLLYPKFYIVTGLEDWLHETVRTRMAERPRWLS